MKEDKKINTSKKKEIVFEKKSAERDYSSNDLNDELERLAQTFREELEKAEELSDEEFIEVFADDLGVIEDEDLCECCGERRKDRSRNKDYQYCSVCRENMKYYPFSRPFLITTIVLFLVAVASVIVFVSDFHGYNYVYKAERAVEENKLDTALEYYDKALVEFSQVGVSPDKVVLDSCDVIFATMSNGAGSMYNISERIDFALTDFEQSMPIYRSRVAMREESLILYSTMQLFYTEILNNEKYLDYDGEDEETYNEIMSEIAAFMDREVAVTSPDKKHTEMVPTSEPMVYFLQYMFAYISGNYDDSYTYMCKTAETAPEYIWLYAYELGIVEAQGHNFKEAKKLAQLIIESNIEESEGYCLYSSTERLMGNYDRAISYANKGLGYDSDNAELLRNKAMALCCKGEFTEAKLVIDAAFESDISTNYGVFISTAIVAENELGNKLAVENYKDKLEEQNMTLSDKMEDYLAGKLTAEQLFTEGSGDVQ